MKILSPFEIHNHKHAVMVEKFSFLNILGTIKNYITESAILFRSSNLKHFFRDS